MSANEEQTAEDAAEQLQAFMIEQVKAGADEATTAARLVEMGVPEDQAGELVHAFYTGIAAAAEAEQFDASALMPAVLGGLVAAVVGGAIWGGIVIATGYEVGYVAWALGGLSGMAVLFFARGRKGPPLQFIAVASSLIGILLGKYVAFTHVLGEQVEAEYGAEAAEQVTLTSAAAMQTFAENLSIMLSGFDIVFVILAVLTAWRIPKAMGIQVPVAAPEARE